MKTHDGCHLALHSTHSFVAAGTGQSGARLAGLTAILLAGITLGVAPLNAADCTSLASLQLKDTTITAATIVPSSGMVPEYCKVLGSIHNLPHSTILFEVSLPTTRWNGKYFVAGGGGYNGTIPRLTQALTEGYAAAGSDTGHVASKIATDGSWALNNLDAQNNYAYLATHVVTVLGKQILRMFYGQHSTSSVRISWVARMAGRWRWRRCSGIRTTSTRRFQATRSLIEPSS